VHQKTGEKVPRRDCVTTTAAPIKMTMLGSGKKPGAQVVNKLWFLSQGAGEKCKTKRLAKVRSRQIQERAHVGPRTGSCGTSPNKRKE